MPNSISTVTSSANSALSSFVLPLSACVSLPPNQLGQFVLPYLHLQEHGFPITPFYVIPAGACQEIAQANEFERFLATAFGDAPTLPSSPTEMSDRLQSKIESFVLPPKLLHEFQQLYVTRLEDEFVRIHTSIIEESGVNPLATHPLKGEMNILESLLKAWAALYSSEFISARQQEWQHGVKTPAAFVIEPLLDVKTSGHVEYSILPQQGTPLIKVEANIGMTIGAATQQNVEVERDLFLLDRRTLHVLNRTIGLKKTTIQPVLDGWEVKPVPAALQDRPCLSDDQLSMLGKLAEQLRSEYGRPIRAYWEHTKEQMFLTRVIISEPNQTTVVQKAPTFIASKTKVYVTSSVQHAEEDLANADGVGVFESAFAFLALDEHPAELLEHRQGSIVKRKLLEQLNIYKQLRPQGMPFFYRTHHFTTEELRQLPHGRNHEPTEIDPFLGYRGATRILHNPQLFDVEIEVLIESYQQSPYPFHILVPFVRTPAEMMLIQKHVVKHLHSTPIKLWMECDTIENILNIKQYARTGVEGFTINLEYIHSLLYGISPHDPEVFHLYPRNITLLIALLRQMKTDLATLNTQLILDMGIYNHELLDVALEIGCSAIIVYPREVIKTKTTIQSIEERLFNGTHTN